MMSPSTFRELVSGRRHGPMATLLRGLLRVCETPYSWAMRIRNRRYDRGQIASHLVDVPVISVGNLTLGGTGKTPLVEWVARFFRDRGVRVSIISRGYAASEEGRNDEALELHLALPDVPHLQNADRVEAAHTAIEELGTELIVLDDGFQHRRLDRDLDIVLLDATEPFGFDHVFPRGTLREPLAGLERADVVVLSRADMLPVDERQTIRQRAAQLASKAAWCEVRHAPQKLVNAHGESCTLESIAGKRVAACCAIGNPAGFRYTIDSLGAEVVAWREFPDHHVFTRDDVESLARWAEGAEATLCTRKDLVKLQVSKLGDVTLWAVEVQLQFSTGQSEIEAALDVVCTPGAT